MNEIYTLLEEKDQEYQMIIQLIFLEKLTCLEVSFLLNKDEKLVEEIYESFLEELRIKGICKIRKLNLAC